MRAVAQEEKHIHGRRSQSARTDVRFCRWARGCADGVENGYYFKFRAAVADIKKRRLILVVPDAGAQRHRAAKDVARGPSGVVDSAGRVSVVVGLAVSRCRLPRAARTDGPVVVATLVL